MKNVQVSCVLQGLSLTFLAHKFGTKDWREQAKVFNSLADVSGTIGRVAILEALVLYNPFVQYENVGDITDTIMQHADVSRNGQIDYTTWLMLTTQAGWTEQ